MDVFVDCNQPVVYAILYLILDVSGIERAS